MTLPSDYPQLSFDECTTTYRLYSIHATKRAHAPAAQWAVEATSPNSEIAFKAIGFPSVDDAIMAAYAFINGLTPTGWIARQYQSANDSTHIVQRYNNGKWACIKEGKAGNRRYDTAALAVDAFNTTETWPTA